MENQVTVADLIMLRNTIDLACSRGAFRAAEMKDIGDVYNKLSVFIDAVVAQAQTQEQPGEASEPKGETQ